MASPSPASSPPSPASAAADWRWRWSPFSSTRRLPDHIDASAVRAVEDPVHANQRVEKSFTVSAPRARVPHLASRGVQELRVRSPGLTIVRVRPHLQKEFGPDALARVRVSSDAEEHVERLHVELSKDHALTLDYSAQSGTVGHLVTEIDVAHADHVSRVVAMCDGDVVVQPGVFGASFARATPALVSLLGARLAVSTPSSDFVCNDLVVGCLGGGSVHLEAAKLKTTTLFAAGVLGRGLVRVDMAYFASNVALCATLGDGATQLTARRGFHAPRLVVHQRGNGAVCVLPAPGAAVTRSHTQRIRASRSGLVDVADVPTYAMRARIVPTERCVVRFQVPNADWSHSSQFTLLIPRWRGTHAILQHVGALPSTFTETFPNATFEHLRQSDEKMAPTRDLGTAPTIAEAFERPVALERARESWLWDVVAPTLRALLPVDV